MADIAEGAGRVSRNGESASAIKRVGERYVVVAALVVVGLVVGSGESAIIVAGTVCANWERRAAMTGDEEASVVASYSMKARGEGGGREGRVVRVGR